MNAADKYRRKQMMDSLVEKDADTLLLPCDCELLGHVTEFRAFRDNSLSPLEIHIQSFLNRQPSFWKRVWIAFKYVFKARPARAYEYDSVILNEYQAIKLKTFISDKIREGR